MLSSKQLTTFSTIRCIDFPAQNASRPPHCHTSLHPTVVAWRLGFTSSTKGMVLLLERRRMSSLSLILPPGLLYMVGRTEVSSRSARTTILSTRHGARSDDLCTWPMRRITRERGNFSTLRFRRKHFVRRNRYCKGTCTNS